MAYQQAFHYARYIRNRVLEDKRDVRARTRCDAEHKQLLIAATTIHHTDRWLPYRRHHRHPDRNQPSRSTTIIIKMAIKEYLRVFILYKY